MRSLQTATRAVVLLTLTSGAFGCGYDNPGFMLKDSDPESDSAAPTTNISGMTLMTTTEASSPTTTASTTESMTSQGPGVSGDETSGTSVDPTTETPATTGTTGTTGEPEPWDADCAGAEVSRTYNILSDTFFMFEDPGVGATACDLGGGLPSPTGSCTDVSFGASPWQQVFNHFSVNENDLSTYTRKVFVAHFEGMEIVDEISKKPVPKEAVVDITLKVFFKRIGGDEPVMFTLQRLETKSSWMAGKQKASKCKAGEASWRCLACSGEEIETCADPGEPWDEGAPYSDNNAGLKTFAVDDATLDDPLSITISEQEHIFTEFPLLQSGHPGFVVIPAPNTPRDTIEIHTLDDGKAPTLTVRHCPDSNA